MTCEYHCAAAIVSHQWASRAGQERWTVALDAFHAHLVSGREADKSVCFVGDVGTRLCITGTANPIPSGGNTKCTSEHVHRAGGENSVKQLRDFLKKCLEKIYKIKCNGPRGRNVILSKNAIMHKIVEFETSVFRCPRGRRHSRQFHVACHG